MITNFKKFNLITENPDTISTDNEYHYCEDEDARPFFIVPNVYHTKVEEFLIGELGCYHSSVPYRDQRAYPGRIWLDSKIMTFWVYPNVELFMDIIKNLEKTLNIKMFNNGWRIEVLKSLNDNEIRRKYFEPDEDEYYSNWGMNKSNAKYTIIPIEEYVGSENVPEELQIQHLMNWKEKEIARQMGKIHFGKWGSYKTGWDQPHNIKYRQAIYQENKKNL